jgi:hypothetical protein
MGENRRRATEEVAAVRLGIALGMTLIDTAEMYGSGGAEEMVAQAAEGVRDDLFIVSKVYPHNASRAGIVAACERSFKRLRTDRIDLDLLHWRGSIPLSETIEGSSASSAKARSVTTLSGGEGVAADQVPYSLSHRGRNGICCRGGANAVSRSLPIRRSAGAACCGIRRSPRSPAGDGQPRRRSGWRGSRGRTARSSSRRQCVRNMCAKTGVRSILREPRTTSRRSIARSRR